MHLDHGKSPPRADETSFDEFLKIDLRVGTVVSAEPFEKARKPAFIVHLDFGEPIGVLKSSAQITENYDCDALIGRQIMAVVNFPPRQIGPIMSECLIVGLPDEEGHVALLAPDKPVANGGRVF